jgi:hypothetical protein
MLQLLLCVRTALTGSVLPLLSHALDMRQNHLQVSMYIAQGSTAEPACPVAVRAGLGDGVSKLFCYYVSTWQAGVCRSYCPATCGRIDEAAYALAYTWIIDRPPRQRGAREALLILKRFPIGSHGTTTGVRLV